MRVFVTVGNAAEPFDRLLAMVDAALVARSEPVTGLCQRGASRIDLTGLDCVRWMGRADFDREVASADVVVCHGGVGTLSTALRFGHRPIALARRLACREHINDHQLEVIAQLARTGDVLDAEGGIDPGMLDEAQATRRAPRIAGASADMRLIEAAMARAQAKAENERRRGRLRLRALEAIAWLGPRVTRVR